MSKELDYIADLERENRLLGERCNQLLKDKGELTDKIADLKANFDLAIEGREVKIKELEDHLAEEIELHLHAEEYIKSLEQQIEKMKVCSNCKHFNKAEDNEYCWNCERHLVNSLDNLKAEEIIKDEWELKND